MDFNIIGALLSAFGIILTIWALWYARVQAKKVSDLERNEIISLCAFLDRIRTLIWEIEHVTKEDDGYVDTVELSPKQRQMITRVFKGLCSEYVSVAEMIVKKMPGITVDDIEEWVKMGRIKTDWQRAQFINLVTAYRKKYVSTNLEKEN